MNSYYSVNRLQKNSDRVNKSKKGEKKRKDQSSTFSRMKGLYGGSKLKKSGKAVQMKGVQGNFVGKAYQGRSGTKDSEKDTSAYKRKTVDSETLLNYTRELAQSKDHLSLNFEKLFFNSQESNNLQESKSKEEFDSLHKSPLASEDEEGEQVLMSAKNEKDKNYKKKEASDRGFLNEHKHCPIDGTRADLIKNENKEDVQEGDPYMTEYEELARLMDNSNYSNQQSNPGRRKIKIHLSRNKPKGKRVHGNLLNYSLNISAKSDQFSMNNRFEGKKVCFKKRDEFPQLSISERAIEVVSVLSKRNIKTKLDNNTESTLKSGFVKTNSLGLIKNHSIQEQKGHLTREISLFNSNGSITEQILPREKPKNGPNTLNQSKTEVSYSQAKCYQFFEFVIFERQTQVNKQPVSQPIISGTKFQKCHKNANLPGFVVFVNFKQREQVNSTIQPEVLGLCFNSYNCAERGFITPKKQSYNNKVPIDLELV